MTSVLTTVELGCRGRERNMKNEKKVCVGEDVMAWDAKAAQPPPEMSKDREGFSLEIPERVLPMLGKSHI